MLSYSYINRETEFFHGYKKDINIQGTGLAYGLSRPMGMDFVISLHKLNADLDGRKTERPHLGAKASLNKSISGDLITNPLWKIHLSLMASSMDLKEYKNKNIDITHSFLQAYLSLSVSRNFYGFIPYAGARGKYLYDEFAENKTDKEISSTFSGADFFAGIKAAITRNIFAQLEVYAGDTQGGVIGAGFAF